MLEQNYIVFGKIYYCGGNLDKDGTPNLYNVRGVILEKIHKEGSCEDCGFYHDCPMEYSCPPKEILDTMLSVKNGIYFIHNRKIIGLCDKE